jgi:hypothetical protein
VPSAEVSSSYTTQRPAPSKKTSRQQRTVEDRLDEWAASRSSPYSKVAFLRHIQKPAREYLVNIAKDGEMSMSLLIKDSVSSPSVKNIQSGDDSSCHFLSIRCASEDEILFMEAVRSFGLLEAAEIAATLHWQCQRPLRALRAAMNGRGRNYSEQNAKRKPLSGSPASLKKRLSNE